MRNLLQHLLPAARSPIGIDFGTSAVRFAQLNADRNQLEAADAIDVPAALPSDWPSRFAFFTQASRELLSSNKFRGREAVLSLPSACVQTCHLRLPKLSESEIAQAAIAAAAELLSLPVGSAVVRHVVAGETEGGKLEVIVMAAPRTLVDDLLRAATRGKLDVVGLDVSAKAALDCFASVHSRAADRESVQMHVDLGHSATRICISSGSHIFFARTLEIVADTLRESHASASDARKQLTADLRMCRTYHDSTFPRKAVARLLFTGGGARETALWQSIAQGLSLPAQAGDPIARLQTSPGFDATLMLDRRVPQPQWAVAIGLASGVTMAAQVA